MNRDRDLRMNDDVVNHWEQALKPHCPLENPVRIGSLEIGNGSLGLIAGPCSIESEYLCLSVAEHLANMSQELGIPYVFKASFDKANRTSITSFRGQGIETGLKILEKVKSSFNLPVLTDVHETDQVHRVAQVVDILQIPAFLCRQTDLLVECGTSAKAVNIKKGQFLAAQDTQYASEKVASSGNKNILLTERGFAFGYRDLIVDMRSLVIMRSFGYPVIFDATHSVQQIGGLGGASGGLTEFIPAQVRGAVAVGIDALFIETHPDPANALSDGSTMVPLKQMKTLMEMALSIHSSNKKP